METLVKNLIYLLATKVLPNIATIRRFIYGSIATITMALFIYIAVYVELISSIKALINLPILFVALFFGATTLTNCSLRWAYTELFNPINNNEENN
jgi:hypothetical protein